MLNCEVQVAARLHTLYEMHYQLQRGDITIEEANNIITNEYLEYKE